jgi:hypothetical protein
MATPGARFAAAVAAAAAARRERATVRSRAHASCFFPPCCVNPATTAMSNRPTVYAPGPGTLSASVRRRRRLVSGAMRAAGVRGRTTAVAALRSTRVWDSKGSCCCCCCCCSCCCCGGGGSEVEEGPSALPGLAPLMERVLLDVSRGAVPHTPPGMRFAVALGVMEATGLLMLVDVTGGSGRVTVSRLVPHTPTLRLLVPNEYACNSPRTVQYIESTHSA